MYVLELLRLKTKQNCQSSVWQWCGKTESQNHSWWGCKMIQTLWETFWWCLTKLKFVLSNYPLIVLLGFTKILETVCLPQNLHMDVYSNFIHSTLPPNWEYLSCPSIGKWINLVQPYNDFAMVVQSVSCIRLFGHPMDCSPLAPLSMWFPRQENGSGLPFPTPGVLSNPELKPAFPSLAGGFFTTKPPGKHMKW